MKKSQFFQHAAAIAAKDVHRLVHDKRGLLMLLIVPLVLMAIVGFSLGQFDIGDAEGSSTLTKAQSIAVVMNDGGRYGDRFIHMLEAEGVQVDRVSAVKEVRAGLARGRWPLAVVVPQGLTARVEDGQRTRIRVILGSGPINQMTGRLIGAVYVNVGYLDAVAVAGRAVGREVQQQNLGVHPRTISDRVEEEVFRSITKASHGLIGVDVRASSSSVSSTAKRKDGPTSVNFFNQVVPGYAVMFALFGIGAGAATLLEEKERGTYNRLLASPVSSGAILLGKTMFQFTLTFVQVLILLGIGILAFGLEVRLWPIMLSLIFALSFATTAFGMLLVSVARSRRQLSGLTTIIVLGFSAVGGSWWPLWLEPEWLQKLAMVSVTYWAMQAFNALLIFQETVGDLLPRLGMLFLYGLLSYALAWALFQRRRMA